MTDFNNYKLFKNVGIRSSDNKLIVMNVNKSNNVSFYSSDGGTNNIDVMSINSIINKSQNEDLNLSSLTGTTINPVITINNNHGDCRITTNLNVAGNVNITKNLSVSNTIVNHNLIIPTHTSTESSLLSNVQGSIYFNTTENMYEGYVGDSEGWQPLGGFSKTKDATIHKNLNVAGNVNLTNGGIIKTTGIGSFGSINCGVGTFTSLDASDGLIKTTGQGSFGSINCGVGTFTSLNSTGDIDAGSNSVIGGTISIKNHIYFDINSGLSLNCPNNPNNFNVTLPNKDCTLIGTDNNGNLDLGAGSVTANTFNGSLIGNADTATKLATARQIGGVSFNGTANITLPGVNTTGTQNTSGTATYALKRSGGGALVDTSSGQTLSNKTFSDSLITNGNLYLGSSNSSSNSGKKIYFHYHDGSIGGSYLYNSGTNQLIYQSGSHWGDANFGIKTNSASGAWAYLRFYTWNGNDYIRAYQGSVQHSGSWSSASDDRLKTDEKKITSDKGKEIIMKLRPQTYYKHQELNSTYDGPKLDSCKIYEAGFIAQEIYFEIPELRFLLSGLSKDHKEMSEIDINNIDFSNIQEDPNYSIFGNDILGVSYEQIVPYLTAHNQEQQKEIDTLKTESQQQQTEINTLKTENTELKSIIDKLKTANSFEDFKNSL